MQQQSAGGGDLRDKIAIITGAGTGIGKAMAAVFVREGATVVVADFSGAQDAVADDLGACAVPYGVDVRDEAQIVAMFDWARAQFGKVDIAVNNAATIGGLEANLSVEAYERMTEVNLKAVMLCCKHGVTAIKAAGGGSIVNVASVAGLHAEAQSSIVYSAAKAGVVSLTRSFAFHHATDGIRVNGIAPGMTRTEKQAQLPEAWLNMAAAKSPMNRLSEPREQAEVAAFLASERASFVTGVTIPVDGGWSTYLA